MPRTSSMVHNVTRAYIVSGKHLNFGSMFKSIEDNINIYITYQLLKVYLDSNMKFGTIQYNELTDKWNRFNKPKQGDFLLTAKKYILQHLKPNELISLQIYDNVQSAWKNDIKKSQSKSRSKKSSYVTESLLICFIRILLPFFIFLFCFFCFGLLLVWLLMLKCFSFRE